MEKTHLFDVKTVNDILEGDTLHITENSGSKRKHAVKKIIKTSSGSVEIILDQTKNIYFNLTMFLEEKSWVKKCQVSKIISDEPVYVKIDRKTLPYDGAKVKFTDNKNDTFEGVFCSGDDLFIISSGNWRLSQEVINWNYIF